MKEHFERSRKVQVDDTFYNKNIKGYMKVVSMFMSEGVKYIVSKPTSGAQMIIDPAGVFVEFMVIDIYQKIATAKYPLGAKLYHPVTCRDIEVIASSPTVCPKQGVFMYFVKLTRSDISKSFSYVTVTEKVLNECMRD